MWMSLRKKKTTLVVTQRLAMLGGVLVLAMMVSNTSKYCFLITNDAFPIKAVQILYCFVCIKAQKQVYNVSTSVPF
jgi:hypothetical protein